MRGNGGVTDGYRFIKRLKVGRSANWLPGGNTGDAPLRQGLTCT